MSEYDIKHQSGDDEIEIDLSVLLCDLWRGFKKLWWIFLIICSLMAGLNYTQSTVRYVPMYESKVSFTVSTQSGYDEANTSYNFYYNQSTAEQLEKLFPYILQTDVMQGLIKEDLRTDAINGSISAEAVPNSNLFTMKVVSGNGAEAKQILEATMKHLPEVTKYVIGETKLNIIQPATTPTIAYNKPSYRGEVVRGFAMGVGLCCVLLLLYALFRRTIRKEEEFRSVLNMRCLGIIPQIKFKAHKKEIDTSASILNKKTGRPFREAIRSLSLKIERTLKENNQKVLMVTSTLPGEGKSMAAMNLALILAEKGKKVLLIDMDLRNPTQAMNLDAIFQAVPMEQVLRGKIPPAQAIHRLEQGIYFIGAKKPLHNVPSLIVKPTLGNLIEEYRSKMDYIIVDTPPCGMISDAATISENCDSILYVIRQDEAKQSQVLDGIQQVTERGTKIIGGVLNGAEGRLSGYGYNYYGYGGYGKYGKYGYGRYGYGRNGKKSKED